MSTKIELPSTFGNTAPVQTYDSPYSNNPSDNALQGKISNGVLTTTFAAPKLGDISGDSAAQPTSYVYGNRLQQIVEEGNPEALVVQNAAQVAAKEGYTRMPQFVDSELVSESFTQEQSLNIIVILMSIIAICIVGACFGFLAFSCRKCTPDLDIPANTEVF